MSPITNISRSMLRRRLHDEGVTPKSGAKKDYKHGESIVLRMVEEGRILPDLTADYFEIVREWVGI